LLLLIGKWVTNQFIHHGSMRFQNQLRSSGKSFQSDKHFEMHFGTCRRVNIDSVMARKHRWLDI